MAAVFVPPSPQTSVTMSSRRAPLANVPNATNSPRRTAQLGPKRSHPCNCQLESAGFQEPPPKRQMLDQKDSAPRSPFRKSGNSAADGKLFTRKNENAPPSAFERKLVAARDKEKQQLPQRSSNSTKNAKAAGYPSESIRQWRQHYRKLFPQFVFYFESVPEDIRYKFSKQVKYLGAHEEKFFSKSVTHVVTSRPIPTDIDSSQAAEGSRDNVSLYNRNANGPVDTVNPTLLDRAGARHGNVDQGREGPATNTNILYRARRMNMKIWPLDKLQRVVSTMNDMDVAPPQGQPNRSNAAGQGRGRAESDLSLALRNEKVQKYADRDTSRDMVPFRGPFIYIHDMDEKTRPVAVREYQKVAQPQDGAWPHFRSAPVGKCPFLMEEPKTETKQETKHTAKQKQVTKAKQPMPTAPKAAPPPEPPVKQSTERGMGNGIEPELSESGDHLKAAGYEDTMTGTRVRTGSPRKYQEPAGFATMDMARIMKQGWAPEPAASGVQPSNITSAIRSQMVSSTAGVNGAKAGTSKEVHELKRKVLEKSNGIVPTGGAASSQKMTDMTAANRPTRAPVPRAAKMKGQGNLGPIREDSTAQTTRECSIRTKQGPAGASNQNKEQEKKKDPKPGYCENCREKFDDFDEHITTRKHRKFALNPSNWTELDDLLELLTRSA